ncbi:dihydroorotase [Alkalibacter saccharofermentans]|uniref:Dihydroorotase n=1 Tax=Alkalibacter saccharofermentans DSM 14828 TaxID=1120975 RepID=A0A1M4TKH0_9FIRM|nr:dihydroorotase [Alkalibacter saccharofermentans]SHE44979.1 dihydroorotase [Alkalibacter saccharofermentans DSM 14828]
MIITNVTLVDCEKALKGSVVIEGGTIKEVTEKMMDLGEDIIDGRGMTLMPAFIDMHAHLREPGYEYKEDLQTGMSAALKGGFVHLCAMANTNPVMDDEQKIATIMQRSEKLNLCDLTQVSAVTKGFEDDETSFVNFEKIRPLTKMFSNDGKNMGDEEAMKKALVNSKDLDFILSCHCEPETEMVEKYVETAKKVGGNLHICHISLKSTLDAIAKAKDEGINITCEVTPHHIFDYGLDYKVAPPFASEKDVEALLEGIKSGKIDVCATDHAPHSFEDKEKGMPGISNIEYAFSAYHTVFEKNGIDISKLSEMLSEKPAKMLGLNMGKIKPGMEANLVLADLKEEYEINPASFLSKGKNTPFAGRKVKGKILMTIKRGEIKYDNR